MSAKGLRHSLIFIKVGISLKKVNFIKYTRNKLDFLPLKALSLHTRALK